MSRGDDDPLEAPEEDVMPTAMKALLWIVVIAVAVVILFTWVFPWVESLQQDPTMGALDQVARSPR